MESRCLLLTTKSKSKCPSPTLYILFFNPLYIYTLVHPISVSSIFFFYLLDLNYSL